MSPSKRLKPVQRVIESRERNAARQLGDSQRVLREQQAKLEELRKYHREYLERFEAAARQGMSAAQLQEYQAFIGKLNEAIRHQEAVVAASQQERTEKREYWQEKYTRSQALDKVVERHRNTESRDRERREQKESDEFGTRLGQRD